MSTIIKNDIADLSFSAYSQIIDKSLSTEHINDNIQELAVSSKFRWENDQWLCNSYYGYAVVSMVSGNTLNASLSQFLLEFNKLFSSILNREPTFYLLPHSSYHQTIANTLSDIRFYNVVKNRVQEDAYIKLIADSMDKIKTPERNSHLQLHVKGLHAFGSCIALLCSINHDDYEVITEFRKQFYSCPELAHNKVKLSRPFIGHITLAYLTRELSVKEKKALAENIVELSNKIREANLVFHIDKCELRQYNNLSAFNANPDFPVYKFA
jgi:2'-5' RNA ligase